MLKTVAKCVNDVFAHHKSKHSIYKECINESISGQFDLITSYLASDLHKSIDELEISGYVVKVFENSSQHKQMDIQIINNQSPFNTISIEI